MVRLMHIGAGVVALAACDSASPTGPTDVNGIGSDVEMCDVSADLRSRGLRDDIHRETRAQWNARLTCSGGTPGQIGEVRVKFGAILLVNGAEALRRLETLSLRSGQSYWICGDPGAAAPTEFCDWPKGGAVSHRVPYGSSWSWRGKWTWCLAWREGHSTLHECPDDPFE